MKYLGKNRIAYARPYTAKRRRSTRLWVFCLLSDGEGGQPDGDRKGTALRLRAACTEERLVYGTTAAVRHGQNNSKYGLRAPLYNVT